VKKVYFIAFSFLIFSLLSACNSENPKQTIDKGPSVQEADHIAKKFLQAFASHDQKNPNKNLELSKPYIYPELFTYYEFQLEQTRLGIYRAYHKPLEVKIKEKEVYHDTIYYRMDVRVEGLEVIPSDSQQKVDEHHEYGVTMANYKGTWKVFRADYIDGLKILHGT
jgi:hypothetical protein